MDNIRGKFVWYDVMTTDTKGAQSFYQDVLGWNAKDSGLTDRAYTIFSVGETGIGGLMALTDDARAMGIPACWSGYIGVDDVDAFADRVQAAGGSIHHAAEDIPDVGRFAVVADPQGAPFILFKGASEMPSSNPAPGTPGHVGWHELYTGDHVAAFAFYADLFGWTKGESIDMGPMGVYQLFAAGGPPIGGMMNKPAQMPVNCWLYYFNVDAIDAAVERVKKAGGTVINGPHEVPGGSFIIQCLDPQHAMFALVAPKR